MRTVWNWVGRGLAVVLTASVLAACSGTDEGAAPKEPEPIGGDRLLEALAQVPVLDTGGLFVMFDESSALAELGNGKWSEDSAGFQGLLGFGARPLWTLRERGVDLTGIDASVSDYTIGMTVKGVPAWGLVAGGQDPKAVSAKFTDNGWVADGDQLVLPDSKADSSDVAKQFGPFFTTIVTEDGNVRFGTTETMKAKDSGNLAEIEEVAAMADCLGEVVTVVMAQNPGQAVPSPQWLAMGIRPTADPKDTAKVVTCAGWSSADAADKHAKAVKAAFKDGRSLMGVPYKETYQDAKIDQPDDKFVRWEAETESDPTAVLESMTVGEVLPGYDNLT